MLISLDTLRADHLPMHGYPVQTSPNLQELADRGVRFSRVYSPSSYTLPTHVTMLSGQHPWLHGVHRPDERIDRRRTPLLARRLRDEGYFTVALTGGGFVDPEFGFDTGFDRYDTVDPGIAHVVSVHRRFSSGAEDARQATLDQREAALREWIRARADGPPFFLFVHTYAVHRFRPEPEYRAAIDAERVAAHRREHGHSTESEVLERVLDYDGSIRQADERVVRAVIESLRDAGLDENTIVSVHSDHGEELYDRREWGHGHTLREEVLRVPWVLFDPNGPHGVEIDVPVPLHQVVPTLLDRMGHDPEVPGGVSPLDLEDPRALDAPLRSHLELDRRLPLQRSLISGPWKLVEMDGESNTALLFNLNQDPGELVDLAPTEQERVRSLRALLQSELARAEQERQSLYGPRADSLNPMSEALRSRLQTLGYLQD